MYMYIEEIRTELSKTSFIFIEFQKFLKKLFSYFFLLLFFLYIMQLHSILLNLSDR